MAAYLSQQVNDESHRDVIGPLLAGRGASGVIVHDGRTVASWGDPAVPEMLFSATKSVVSLVAGIAYDLGLLDIDAKVGDSVELPQFHADAGRDIRWLHLLQQTSQWHGELWTKPALVDAQSHREGDEPDGGPPGSGWAYNDVRVNLLCLALTALLRRSLPDVLREAVMVPLGASGSWSWHGYRNSHLDLADRQVPVVSGGAHWGGGLFMSASDLARIGRLYLTGGRWAGRQLVTGDWLARSWQPCAVKREYGFLWWRNDLRTVFANAPASGRAARGNGGRHLLWVDPDRDLVIASHWGDGVEQLVSEVSAAVVR
ncbi:MAG TPA: serine hydrolase [Actinophytocola sp.]|nr:serine hydrolase [Actinophytocola sp.]